MLNKNPLVYDDHSSLLPEDCIFKISPSSFSNFITTPHRWYRTEILKEKDFEYNTSTVLGTCVHYCAEQAAKGRSLTSQDKKYINEYIDSFDITENYDPEEVKQQLPLMAETLINSFVLNSSIRETEKFVITSLSDGVYVGGTLDAISGTKEDCMIIDYKTYNSKAKPRAFHQAYRYQLLVYAYILRSIGYNPTRMKLVYINRNIDGEISEKTGKRLKSYPPEVTELTEVIDEESLEFIESTLKLCVDTLKADKKHPELRHIIWHDWRLKENI